MLTVIIDHNEEYYQNKKEAQGKDDIVDQISEAAQKLLDDPNSYYYHLQKDEKMNIRDMMEKESNKTGEFPKIGKEAQVANSSPKRPIEPYPRAAAANPTIKRSSISRSKSPNEAPDLRNHNIINPVQKEKESKHSEKYENQEKYSHHEKHEKHEKREKYENVAEKRKKLFDKKPAIKKKKIDPPQVKLPPAPKYVPLPCLECKNISTVCEALGISKIEEAIKIINDLKQGKFPPKYFRPISSKIRRR